MPIKLHEKGHVTKHRRRGKNNVEIDVRKIACEEEHWK
jgi:hypothetical protein